MLRSLFTGVSGLKQHQTRMDVVSNNIANVNTTGFKRGRAMFQDLFSETLRHAQQAFGNYGGLNPMQVGLGVRLGSIDTLMEQGTLETTGKNTDLAIEGQGFFVVNSNNDVQLYTRDGNFTVNPAFDLVSTNTGFQLQGWLSQQDPLTGNLVLENTGGAAYDLNIIKYLKKFAHQTNNITYASNLDSSSPDRDVKMGNDVLTYKDSAGKYQNLSFKFKKNDKNNWTWTAYDESEGNVATGAIKTDETGQVLSSTVDPPGLSSSASTPYFTYDPDGTPQPAAASSLVNDPQNSNTGNGISSNVNASGNDVADETISVIFDGGDPTKASSYRVVGTTRGFIGSGTLGGTSAEINTTPIAGPGWVGDIWTPTANADFTITYRQNLDSSPAFEEERAATINFPTGASYSITQVVDNINTTFKNAGVLATAFFDSGTRKIQIVTNDRGGNRQLQLTDNNAAGGMLTELGLAEQTINGTGGAKPMVLSAAVGSPGGVDFSDPHGNGDDKWTPTANLSFRVTDRNGKQAEVNFPRTVNNVVQSYTRGQIISIVQTALSTNNVDASVSMVDTTGNGQPDRLVMIGNREGSGETIRLDQMAGNLADLGLNPAGGTNSGSASVSEFNSGGLAFTLTEGINQWIPNDKMTMTTYAAKGQASSINIFAPQPSTSVLSFSATDPVNGEKYSITGAVNQGAKHGTSIVTYDTLGTAHSLITEWEHTNSETKEWTYNVHYYKDDPEIFRWMKDPGNGVIDPKEPTDAEYERANDALIKKRKGTVFFENNGKINLAKSIVSDLSFTPTGSNPITISLDMGMITQFESDFTTAAREQDGYEMGLLETMYFEQDGTVRGVYSNGQKQPIGQVALAAFNNPSGLEKKGKNLYEQSPNSGQASIGKPDQGLMGTIVPGSLEMSNVDIAEEFTSMIITQRAFQANSRVITTSDEILQEIVNLKR